VKAVAVEDWAAARWEGEATEVVGVAAEAKVMEVKVEAVGAGGAAAVTEMAVGAVVAVVAVARRLAVTEMVVGADAEMEVGAISWLHMSRLTMVLEQLLEVRKRAGIFQ